jgi:hypothetical protein
MRSAESTQLASDPAADRRMAALEERVERLNKELQGLQDAVHRQAVTHDERIAELRRRTEPEHMARALSADARRRGL